MSSSLEAVGFEEEVESFVVACPNDVTMFEDAIKTSGSEDSIRLVELTELVADATSTGMASDGIHQPKEPLDDFVRVGDVGDVRR